MSGFSLTPSGNMVITKGSRTVLTTAGRLVSLLPSSTFGTDASPHTVTATWPDFTKNRGYQWVWNDVYNGANQYSRANAGASWADVPPQEWSNTTILAAAPAGCNLFASKVRINRTVAPNVTWVGSTVTVKPTQNVWIPFTGSVLIEAAIGMARAFSLYIDGSNNLVLHQQQSVSTPPGGWGNYGATTAGPTVGGNSNGGIWWDLDPTGGFYGPAYDGLPVYKLAATGPDNDNVTTIGNNNPGEIQTCNVGGPNQASLTDVTHYASTYTIDIVGEFGRAT